jgi:quercetin dioxygenase-like cupin family protein
VARTWSFFEIVFDLVGTQPPKGYRVPPHTHPVDEILTVITGTFIMGMGENTDQRVPTLSVVDRV